MKLAKLLTLMIGFVSANGAFANMQTTKIPSDFFNGEAARMGWTEYSREVGISAVYLSPDRSIIALPSSPNFGVGENECDFSVVGDLNLSSPNNLGERKMQISNIKIVPASDNVPSCQSTSREVIMKNILPIQFSSGAVDPFSVVYFGKDKLVFGNRSQQPYSYNQNIFIKTWPK